MDLGPGTRSFHQLEQNDKRRGSAAVGVVERTDGGTWAAGAEGRRHLGLSWQRLNSAAKVEDFECRLMKRRTPTEASPDKLEPSSSQLLHHSAPLAPHRAAPSLKAANLCDLI